jgi:hypothetical protein
MLETPAIDVLLAGVEERPDTTLGDLLTFMKVFHLRFGVAQSPRQKEVYNAIYPLLVQLRAVSEPAIASQTTADAGSPGSSASRANSSRAWISRTWTRRRFPSPGPDKKGPFPVGRVRHADLTDGMGFGALHAPDETALHSHFPGPTRTRSNGRTADGSRLLNPAWPMGHGK